MARNFSNFGNIAPYQTPAGGGLVPSLPIATCRAMSDDPRAAPFVIRWIDYGASTTNSRLAVRIAVQQVAGAAQNLRDIRSIYIDNTFSDQPIYVQMIDTRFTITCPPNAAGWFPVATNNAELIVYTEGFVTGNIPETYILVSNVDRQGILIPANFDYAPSISMIQFTSGASTVAAGTHAFNFNNVPVGAGSKYIVMSAFAFVTVTGGPPPYTVAIASATVGGLAATIDINNNGVPSPGVTATAQALALLHYGPHTAATATITVTVTLGGGGGAATSLRCALAVAVIRGDLVSLLGVAGAATSYLPIVAVGGSVGMVAGIVNATSAIAPVLTGSPFGPVLMQTNIDRQADAAPRWLEAGVWTSAGSPVQPVNGYQVFQSTLSAGMNAALFL